MTISINASIQQAQYTAKWQNGGEGTQGEEGCSKMSVSLLPALPTPEDRDNHWPERGAMALLVPCWAIWPPSAADLWCLCLSLPFPPAVAAGSSTTLQSPVLAHPLALPLPFLWQEQPAHGSRWQNSFFPPLSLPCTSLFVSIFLSINFMQCLY